MTKRFKLLFFTILFISISVQVSFANDGDNDIKEDIISFPELPEIDSGKRRLYIVKNLGDVSKVHEQLTTKQKFEKGVDAYVLSQIPIVGRGQLSDNINAFFRIPNRSSFELFSLDNDDLMPLVKYSRFNYSSFIDIEQNFDKELIFGVTHFANNYDPDVGKIRFRFKTDKVHVLVLARQAVAPIEEKFISYQQALVKKAQDEDDFSYVAPTSMGKWGISVLEMDKIDAQFCQDIRIKPMTDTQLAKEITTYSRNFVQVDSKLKSNTLFNLGCMAIARSKPAKHPSKRSIKKAKKIKAKLDAFISQVDLSEIQAENIILKNVVN